ncbi:hypothetical protein HDR58_07010 [bacterium]|nr:hypothetical protein [bacterium]
MKVNSYCLEKKEIDKFTQNAARIYNIVVVLSYFCNEQPEIEELCNITPIVNYLRREADNLYADLLDLDDNE